MEVVKPGLNLLEQLLEVVVLGSDVVTCVPHLPPSGYITLHYTTGVFLLFSAKIMKFIQAIPPGKHIFFEFITKNELFY